MRINFKKNIKYFTFVFSLLFFINSVSAESFIYLKNSSGQLSGTLIYEPGFFNSIKLQSYCFIRSWREGITCEYLNENSPIAQDPVKAINVVTNKNISPDEIAKIKGDINEIAKKINLNLKSPKPEPVANNVFQTEVPLEQEFSQPSSLPNTTTNPQPATNIVYQVIERAVPGPRGEAGPQGPQGLSGPQGIPGQNGSGGGYSAPSYPSSWNSSGAEFNGNVSTADLSGYTKTGTDASFTGLSASTIYGGGLSTCNGLTQKLLYNSTTKLFECGTDGGGTSSATSSDVILAMASTSNASTSNVLTGNISNLNNTNATLTNATITNLNISGSISGVINGSGTSTFSTTTAASSSITNLNSSNLFASLLNSLLATITTLWGTTSNFAVSNASTTNATTSNAVTANATTGNFTNLNSTNSTNTNSTSTNFFATNSSTTNQTSVNTNTNNLNASSSQIANATITNSTSTNIYAQNASITTITTNSLFSAIFNSLLATITTLWGTTSNFAVSNASTTNATTTNTSGLTTTGSLNSTNATLTNATATNLSATNFSTPNLTLGTTNGWLYGLNGVVNGSSSPTVGYITATSSTSTFLGLVVNGSIIPGLDNTYDLGSPTNKFRSLYVSSSTIYIEGTPLSNSSGQLTWGGTGIVATLGTSSLGTTTITGLNANQATLTNATATTLYVNTLTSGLTNGYIWRGNSSNLNEATSSLFIADNGRVGIGATAPTANLEINQGTVTGLAQGLLALSGTWNNAGNIYKGIDLNITNTAAHTNSTLLNIALAGSSVFKVTAAGNTIVTGNLGVTGTTTLNSGLDLSSNKIINLATPVNNTDAANKSYVDGFVQGVLYKSPVISVSTTSIVSSTTGDRYIVGVGSSGTGCAFNTIAQNTGIGSWSCETPATGTSLFVDNGIDTTYSFNGSNWVSLGSTVNHANLIGLQGGTAGEYYHINASQYGNLNSVNAQLSQLLTTGTATQFVNLTLTGGLIIGGTGATLTNSTTTNLSAGNITNTTFTGINATITNATFTNSFATIASSTNLYSSLATLASAVISQLNATLATITTLWATTGNIATLNASTTNATTSNAVTTNTDNLIGTNATLTNATFTNVSVSGSLNGNFNINSSATSTFATTTAASSTITNLSSNNATINTLNNTNLTSANATLTNSTSTNISTTQITGTTGNLTTINSTNISNSGSSTLASTTVTNITGQIAAFLTGYINTLNSTLATITTLWGTTSNFATSNASTTNATTSNSINSNISNTLTTNNLTATGTSGFGNATITSAGNITTNGTLAVTSSTTLASTTLTNFVAQAGNVTSLNSGSTTVTGVTASGNFFTTGSSTLGSTTVTNITGSIGAFTTGFINSLTSLTGTFATSVFSPLGYFTALYATTTNATTTNTSGLTTTGNLYTTGSSTLASTTIGNSTFTGITNFTNLPNLPLTTGYTFVGSPTGLASATNTLFITNSGFVGIGTTTPLFKLEIAGTSTVADRKIGINGTQMLYLPDQTSTVFLGSLFIGNGGQSLSNAVPGIDGRFNTGVGINSLFTNTVGRGNNAVGYNSLYDNTSGSFNNAFGFNALASSTLGVSNSAFGNGALRFNTSGGSNVALGQSALFSNTTASNNTAIGLSSMQSNTTGTENVAVGAGSLFTNSTGNNNTALGYFTLNLNTASGNTAVGHQAIISNSSGANNVAVGYLAGADQTTGSNNTYLGYNTGRGITTGGSNTIIGSQVLGLAAGLSNNIIIADGDGNRRINVDSNGNVGIAMTNPSVALDVTGDIEYTGTITDVSDERLKKNIQNIASTSTSTSLEILSKLQGKSFNMLTDEEGAKKEFGFLAQDVVKVIPEAVSFIDPANTPTTTPETPFMGVSYLTFIPFIVDAINELAAKFESIIMRILTLESEVQILKQEVQQLKNQSGSNNNSGYTNSSWGNNSGTTTNSTSTNLTATPTAPVVILVGSANLTLNVGDTYMEGSAETTATISDDQDTGLTLVISGSVDTSTPGTYIISYSSAPDTQGNVSNVVTRKVTVVAANNNSTTTASTTTP